MKRSFDNDDEELVVIDMTACVRVCVCVDKHSRGQPIRVTRSSDTADGPRDALCQSKSG